ncbi:hypothetical protein OG453_44660 [Streptomyces sp. NBC_01381]|uniref:hypothetical protein n=1 Tax=Streptomyces sp. NBC_01381 TaxID=2903845 RepID=UPI00225B4A52|nr:hypothetical protein [Streptomyces sp. NBC_01381]MCX4673652.1 hypothetical protein [Streptomyces sp. NBC_01381]
MRLRIRRRPTPSADSPVRATGWDPAQHSCSEVVDGMPQLESPLVTELIALRAHTRHLGWLSSRETCPDQYRHLARIALQGLLEGWQHQTGGCGRLEDLLPTCPPDPGERGQDSHLKAKEDSPRLDVTSGARGLPFRG